MLISEKFLAHFEAASTRWRALVPGRCAVLHLARQDGDLYIYVAYFATGVGHVIGDPGDVRPARRQRAEMRRILAAALQPPV